MNADTFLKRLWVLWLALPATVLNYWIVGSFLPARIAMHHDASGHPTAWATPQEARVFALKVLVFVLAVVTAVGYLVVHSRPDRARPALVVLYLAVLLVWAILNGFVWFKLGSYRLARTWLVQGSSPSSEAPKGPMRIRHQHSIEASVGDPRGARM